MKGNELKGLRGKMLEREKTNTISDSVVIVMSANQYQLKLKIIFKQVPSNGRR